MHLLVTGGAGFIGGHFCRYWLKNHPADTISCLDLLTYAGNLSSIKDLLENNRFSLIVGDVCDRNLLEKIGNYKCPDIIVHFAAETHVDRSINTPDVFLKTNILGTGALLDFCRIFPVKRFHQVSTDEVYGDLPISRRDLLFTENTPIHPSSPYAAAKASADLLVQSYIRTFGISATISRCSNNYGSCQYPEKLIPLMISRALTDQSLPVYGDGSNVRDWLYVEDHCSAIESILLRGQPGQIYNIGGNCELSNMEIIKRILLLLSKPQSLITFVEDRHGHDKRYAIDASFLRESTGWKPATTFDIGIAQTVQWYTQNFNWLESQLNGSYQDTNALLSAQYAVVN